MDTALGHINGLLDRNSLLSVFAPPLLATLVALFHALMNGFGPSLGLCSGDGWDCIREAAVPETFAGIAVVAVTTAFVCSVLLRVFQRRLLELAMGHWPAALAVVAQRRRAQWLAARKRHEDDQSSGADNDPNSDLQWKKLHTRDWGARVPESDWLVMPTAFGNVMRKGHEYPLVRYDADGTVLWPRLRMLLTDEDLASLDGAEAVMHFMLNLSLLSGIGGLLLLLELTFVHPQIQLSALGIVPALALPLALVFSNPSRSILYRLLIADVLILLWVPETLPWLATRAPAIASYAWLPPLMEGLEGLTLGMSAAAVCYAGAIGGAIVYAERYRAIWDLHRNRLLEALGLEPQADPDKERATWRHANSTLRDGNPLGASSDLRPLDVVHWRKPGALVSGRKKEEDNGPFTVVRPLARGTLADERDLVPGSYGSHVLLPLELGPGDVGPGSLSAGQEIRLIGLSKDEEPVSTETLIVADPGSPRASPDLRITVLVPPDQERAFIDVVSRDRRVVMIGTPSSPSQEEHSPQQTPGPTATATIPAFRVIDATNASNAGKLFGRCTLVALAKGDPIDPSLLVPGEALRGRSAIAVPGAHAAALAAGLLPGEAVSVCSGFAELDARLLRVVADETPVVWLSVAPDDVQRIVRATHRSGWRLVVPFEAQTRE